MFGYSHPNLKELLGYPFLVWVVSLALCGAVPAGEWRELAQFGYVAVCINLAIVPSIYLVKQFSEMSESQFENTAPSSVKEYLNLNTGKAAVYSQNVITLKMNSVMAFNKILVTQKASGLEVDMTESFWLVKKSGMDETEWQKAGGTGRADFIDMIGRGVAWKSYKRVGGKGKPVPDQWRKVAQLAQGYPLPQWEQLPKQ